MILLHSAAHWNFRHSILMKNCTLICGKEYLCRKVLKKWMSRYPVTVRQGNSKCKKTSQLFSRLPWECPEWELQNEPPLDRSGLTPEIPFMASLWIRSGYDMKVEVSAETYQVGAHFKALIKAILVAPLKSFERFFRISSSSAGLWVWSIPATPFFGLVLAVIFSAIWTSSGCYLAVKISILDSPWLVFLLVWIVLAGIFWEIWTSGRYFWTNLDYWPVFLDQLGLLAGIFGPIRTIGRYF